MKIFKITAMLIASLCICLNIGIAQVNDNINVNKTGTGSFRTNVRIPLTVYNSQPRDLLYDYVKGASYLG